MNNYKYIDLETPEMKCYTISAEEDDWCEYCIENLASYYLYFVTADDYDIKNQAIHYQRTESYGDVQETGKGFYVAPYATYKIPFYTGQEVKVKDYYDKWYGKDGEHISKAEMKELSSDHIFAESEVRKVLARHDDLLDENDDLPF